MFFSPDNNNISYMGRIDFANPAAPQFFFPGAQAAFRTDGSFVKATLNVTVLWGVLSLGAVIDGEVRKIPVSAENNGKDVTFTLAEGLPAGMHDIILFKMHAGNQFFTLKSIETDGELYPDERKYDLKLEVFGDSVCAGEVIEAIDYVGKQDPTDNDSHYDNVRSSFVMQTARNLNAKIHNNSQGGIALFDGTGYFHFPKYIGLESTYDKIRYFPEGGELSVWNFSDYIPDIVIIAIGQNDKHNGKTEKDDLDISDPAYRQVWKTAYKKLVMTLNRAYGGTKFVLTTTILMHDLEWDKAIGEICDELNADGIFCRHNMFSRNGAATPGHPRLPEHDEMAAELTAFIRENVL